MTMTKPISYYLAPGLLVLSMLLAGVNWYLQPARAGFWTSAIVVLGCMMLVFFLAHRRSENDARRRAADAIRQAIVFAGLMMAIPLSMSLATRLGAVHDADLSRRMTMVLMGAFVAFTGNAMPKTLTPLSALQCDGAKVQAFQRFAGWTWVLSGVAFAIAWLVLPLDLAKPVSVVLLTSGMLVVALQLIRLRRTRAAH
jgi:Sec-independent protein secretion pathway component TatC